MEQLKFDLDSLDRRRQASGYFRYSEHYTYDGADNIYISMLDNNKVKIMVTTPDNVYTRSNFIFNKNELQTIAEAISLSWKNNSTNFKTEINSNRKHIIISTMISKNTIDKYKYEKNKHLSIKVNNKTIIYGFDIKDSRRLYKLLIDLVKYGRSEELC